MIKKYNADYRKMDIIHKVKSLNLPEGKYIVIGGASLAIRGIRKTKDIDIFVSPEVYKELKGKGYKEKVFPNGDTTLLKGHFEIGTKFIFENYEMNFSNLIKNVKVIEGVPFTSLEDELKFKKAMGRDKDIKDVELIETYLS